MIYLIRHGQTEKNKANVLQGRADFPLNELGEQQAAEAGARFRRAGIRFDKVYASPLIRARRTAELITGNAPLVIDERLIEMDYGPYEGTNLKNPPPELRSFFSDFARNPAPEGMETLAHVVARMGVFLEELRHGAGPETAGGDILIATHAIAMKGALEYLTPDACGRYWAQYLSNCEVYVTGLDDAGQWIVPRPWNGDGDETERGA